MSLKRRTGMRRRSKITNHGKFIRRVVPLINKANKMDEVTKIVAAHIRLAGRHILLEFHDEPAGVRMEARAEGFQQTVVFYTSPEHRQILKETMTNLW